MNWDYFPIGTNYSYSLWAQPDSFIRTALDYEMSLLKDMGVNTLRQYSSIPPRWIKHIYEQFGIYTVLNHSCARYGLLLDSVWVGNTDYSDQRTRQVVLTEIKEMVAAYKDTPGLLMWLLGNENNYGLHWNSAETGNTPTGEDPQTFQARQLYSLLSEAVKIIHADDPNHPVAMANGDLLYLDIIAEEMPNLDVFGANVYRGRSFEDLFQRVEKELGIPVFLTEFGADAFNARKMQEDQQSQATYLKENWREIYENASGLGLSENAIGGFTFQFSDGWWKSGQTTNLDSHDTHASWSNGGYSEDYNPNANNMNEEWFGICAKAAIDEDGYTELMPRLAYGILQQVHTLDPYQTGLNRQQIKTHFSRIKP